MNCSTSKPVGPVQRTRRINVGIGTILTLHVDKDLRERCGVVGHEQLGNLVAITQFRRFSLDDQRAVSRDPRQHAPVTMWRVEPALQRAEGEQIVLRSGRTARNPTIVRAVRIRTVVQQHPQQDDEQRAGRHRCARNKRRGIERNEATGH